MYGIKDRVTKRVIAKDMSREYLLDHISPAMMRDGGARFVIVDLRKQRIKKRNRGERPVVLFRKRNGGKFEKRFKSRAKAARAIRAWRAKGGEVLGRLN